MIKVKAYGHIGKALGKEELEIDKEDTIVKSGDKVVLIPITHGG